MHSCKLYQFVNSEFITRNINDGTIDVNLRKSAFQTPAYLGGTFPFYQNVDNWPRSPEMVGRQLIYTAKYESPVTLSIDKDLNISLRNAISRTDNETLMFLSQEIICFLKYFNKLIINLNTTGYFKFVVVLEDFSGIHFEWNGFKEIHRIGSGRHSSDLDELPRLTNWNFIDREIIEINSPIKFELPLKNENKLFDKYKECIADMILNIAFNVEGDRFYPLKGRIKDRLRLDKDDTIRIIDKLISDELDNNRNNMSDKNSSNRKPRLNR